ncbi:MAG: glycosyltransferase family 4 protein [Patescibacteria group bacterium]
MRGSPAKNKILVNLAGILPPPGSNQIIHGGKPKFLHIRERFGDSWKHFNIAYFGSSSLPFAPTIWMRIYKLFGVKVAWNQNGIAYPAVYPEKIVKRINNLLMPIHLSDYVIYQTEFVKRCADKYLGEFKGLSSIIINPVDTHHFKPREIPPPQEPLVIIMLGNHFESKERMDVSIRALKILREKGVDLKLMIIGRIQYDIEEDWIEKRGAYLQKDAPTLIQQAHIFLHLKYMDPCPITVLEALSCGLPIVALNNGGLPEMVDDNSGVLVSVLEDFEKLHYPSAEEVADAIIKIKDNYKGYSEAARNRAVKLFDKGRWLDKHREIFDKLLA